MRRREEISNVRPQAIRTEKLVIKTFIFGTAFPSTANEMLIRKFIAINGAAMRVPKTHTVAVSRTKPRVGFAF
jgi:hypothetical protein